MTGLLERLRGTTFRRQISLTVAAGVLLLAVLASLASSWQGTRRIHDTLLRQGANVTGNLADQSRLALLVGSAENASDALQATLAFPDVIAVEIVDVSGNVLVRKAKRDAQRPFTVSMPKPVSNGVTLAFEDDDIWSFSAPVVTESSDDSPFELNERKQETLGVVHVMQSKATLKSLRNGIFLTNILVSTLFALLFLAAIRALTRRLTRPLNDLSVSMALAESGERGVRATPHGARDLVVMARAFNRMMNVLEDRERELIEARDVAIAFAQLKAQFAATVSHEVRTPLNGVIGTLDMLMASPLPPRQHQFVELAWDSARYLLDLINDVLDFSRLEAGKVLLETQPLDLAQVIEGVVDTLASQAHQKGLEIGYALTIDVPTHVLGDARRLRQVLTNLVGNAVKFTQRGEVGVRVRRALQDGDEYLHIEVSDTGPGVDPSMHARIFESFTQGDAFSTRRFEGSGLGLAICRELVKLMNGSIGVNSQPGEGSSFWFRIPLQHDATSPTPAVPVPTQHVLVVDHNEITHEFCASAMPRMGFSGEHCTELSAARRLLQDAMARHQAYDAVMLDHGMGSAVELENLRQTCAEAARKWIVMSPLTQPNPAEFGTWDAVLPKPLRMQRMVSCMHAVSLTVAVEERVQAAIRFTGMVRVLVVEDNRTNQAVTLGMLGMLGATAEVAADGHAALEAFTRQAWDLILMDCQMPGMDGFETTTAMRQAEQQSGGHVPIVAMTANVNSADVERCNAVGMDDHLAKPFTLEALRAKLRRWLPLAHAKLTNGPQEELPLPLISDEAIDPAVLKRLREALGGALGEAVQPFLEDMPENLLGMRQALSERDATRLRDAAHRIKGSAGNLGAMHLAAVAKEIDMALEADDLNAVALLLERLSIEYDRVESALLRTMSEPEPVTRERKLGSARVLVVDDDRSTRSALRYALQLNGFQVDEAENGHDAIATLERIAPDVILLDAVMPGQDGIATCALIKDLPHANDIPVLMITALDDRHSIERAFAAGASDYLTKPLHFNVVVQRVRRTVEASRAEQHVRHLAYNDTLTGLPNRALFHDRLKQQIEQARKIEAMLAVLFLDLDRFKFVNDTLGHEIGDRLLTAVAQRIKHCVRAGDSVARLGGDEFTVVLEELHTTAAAATAAQKIAQALSEPFIVDGNDIFVTTSIGISIYPADGEDVTTLLRHADTAMYQAKRSNRGFRFYDGSMDLNAGDHLRLESALRRAMERGELSLHYQPEMHTASGRLYCAEALLRWNLPGQGMIPPVDFIPLAEETGMIIPIGEWVLRTACYQIKEWLTTSAQTVRIAINLSGRQLQDGRFANIVESILEETGLDPQHLIFEITESVWMEQAGEALSTLHRLRQLGAKLAIDDFGTGYSSLSYLKRLPVNILKIDRAFIKDIVDDSSDAAIVRGIVALAKTLNLDVVAEGVETAEQLRILQDIGCDYVQGYLLSRPMPAEQFTQTLLASEQLS